MKTIIFILSFLFCSALMGQNRWDNVDNILGIPQGIAFADSNTCFTLTTQGLTNRLFKSSNQGEDWEMIWGVNDNARIYSANTLAAVDSNIIYMGFNRRVLLRSHDRGEEFFEIELSSEDRFDHLDMYNKNIGVISTNTMLNNFIQLTRDAWNTYQVLPKDPLIFGFAYPRFLNDSILCIIGRSADKPRHWYCHKMNINTLESETHLIDIIDIIQDFHIVNENLMFVCGKKRELSGGSGDDVIYRTTDAGRTWENVLEIRPGGSKLPGIKTHGLQSITFKDSLTGIAVGQFGKIIYTYDSGNSWHYEANLHESIVKSTPPTMIVRYAGTQPIIATFTRHIYKLREDNLAPKPNDNLSISGRVWNGENGQARIPIALNDYHITMTDKDGYYKFTNLASGAYTVKPLNKYFDGPNELYYYKPFEYSPEKYSFELTNDTTGIDFNAVDLRVYFDIQGQITDSNNVPLQGIQLMAQNYLYYVDTLRTLTDDNGNFSFNALEGKRSWGITPLSEDFTFEPNNFGVRLFSDTANINFIALPVIPDTNRYYAVGGRVSQEGKGNLALISIRIGNATTSTTTNPNKELYGTYKFPKIIAGEHRVIPETSLIEGWEYRPAYYDIDLQSDMDSLNFEIVKLVNVADNLNNSSISHYISGDKLYINTELNTHNLTIKIYDILGNKVLSTAYKQEIDISKYPSGIYFLNIFENETLIKQEKFIIIK